MPYSAVTQPLPWPLRNGGTLSSSEAVQMHLGVAELHEHRALGVAQVVAGDRDRPELVRASPVVPEMRRAHRLGNPFGAGLWVWAVRKRWS